MLCGKDAAAAADGHSVNIPTIAVTTAAQGINVCPAFGMS